MGHVRIRHVDDAVIERLMQQADAKGMEVEDYLRAVLVAAADSGSAPETHRQTEPGPE
ncbi:MAG: hypothetical protein G8237_04355 [Magnetococcales bacterium]|nr:hypothetical protein [Magnetococcales bacterium]